MSLCHFAECAVSLISFLFPFVAVCHPYPPYGHLIMVCVLRLIVAVLRAFVVSGGGVYLIEEPSLQSAYALPGPGNVSSDLVHPSDQGCKRRIV